MKTLLFVAASALVLVACTPAKTPAPVSVEAETAVEVPVMTLQEAVASDLRSEQEKARDAWRHPVETLEFFGLQPAQKVVEVWPGGGWYTNILAPWIGSGGGSTPMFGM